MWISQLYLNLKKGKEEKGSPITFTEDPGSPLEGEVAVVPSSS